MPFEKVNSAESKELFLTVDESSLAPVNLKKYGVNGALLGSEFGYASDELVDIFNQTGMKFNRFPGGTIGNFYNWKSGNFSCYQEPDKKHKKRISNMNKRLIKSKTTYNVDSFFKFVTKTDGDFAYVLNTICGSPKNNFDLIKHMKEKNVDLNYVEMGNETYSRNYKWAYENAQSYLTSAQNNYSAIKHFYPDAKVGMVVSPMSFVSRHPPSENGIPNKRWPKNYRRYDEVAANSTMADALIMHIYGHAYKHKSKSFEVHTYKEHYLEFINEFNDRFHLSLRYLSALGKGKPIWLTEWGVTDPSQRSFRSYSKSPYQALYLASALSTITLEKNIEIANYHIISSLWNKSDHGFEITPIGEVFKLFIDAAKNTDRVYNVSIGEGLDHRNEREYKQEKGIKTLKFTSKQVNFLFVINEKDKDYVINTLDTESNKHSNFTIDTMYIDNDIFKYSSNEKLNLNDIQKVGIRIKPFSISRITIH